MNPPFGTRVKGVDVLFLKAALSRCTVVYSLHKSSTREFLMKKFHRSPDHPTVEVQILFELKFDLAKTHAFHTSKSKDVRVDLIRLEHK